MLHMASCAARWLTRGSPHRHHCCAETPGVVARVHGRRLPGPRRHPVRVAGHRRHGGPGVPGDLAPTRSTSPATRRVVVADRPVPRGRRRSRRSTSTTSRCRRCSTWRRRCRRRGPRARADKGTNKCYYWELVRRRLRGVQGEGAAEGGKVVKRRFIQQRLIPNAMEPRAVVCAPMAATGEITLWSATQIPHVLRVLLALTTGIPEHKIRVIAPDVGGGFGSKLQTSTARRSSPRGRQASSGARSSGPSRRSEYQATHHGRDQIQDIEIAATSGRHHPRPQGRPARRHGRLPADHHARHPAARRVHVQRDLQDRGATTSPAPASSPTRRRPTPTAAPAGPRRRTRSSGSWTSSPPSSAWTRWSCARRTGSSTRSSRTRRSPG
jgi:hypothetical protein